VIDCKKDVFIQSDHYFINMTILKLKYLFILALLFFFSGNFTSAQAKRYPFDPVPFFSRLTAEQEWTSDMFVIPSNARATYADSILENKYVMAVTLHLDDVDSAGWKLTLYFDADRYGTLRFMRAYGRRDVIHPDEREFAKFAEWIEKVMREKVSGKEIVSPDEMTWRWTQNEAFILTLQRVGIAEDSVSYFLSFELKEESEKRKVKSEK